MINAILHDATNGFKVLDGDIYNAYMFSKTMLDCAKATAKITGVEGRGLEISEWLYNRIAREVRYDWERISAYYRAERLADLKGAFDGFM